jgi:tRNA(adenine34) deaminase
MRTDPGGDQAERDLEAMTLALAEARAAAEAGETPVGAVILDPATGEILARAGNGPIGAHDPTAHAEIAAMRIAAAKLGNYRLTDLTLVVTWSPAPCAPGRSATRGSAGWCSGPRIRRAGRWSTARSSSPSPPATGGRR